MLNDYKIEAVISEMVLKEVIFILKENILKSWLRNLENIC